jgi:hypothetical protein
VPVRLVQLTAADVQASVGARADAVRALTLEVFSAERSLGRRTLAVRSRDCAALPGALALVLVLLAEETSAAAQRTLETGSPPPAADSATPEPGLSQMAAEAGDLQPAAAEVAAPSPVSELGGSLALGAGAGVSFGALPKAAFALLLQVSSLTEPIAFRARAALLWPQELAVAEGYVLMQDYELALEACPGAQLGARPWLALRLCVGPRLGLFLARARDFNVQNARAAEFLMYLGVTPEASLALGSSTWLQLSAGAAISLVRPRMRVAFGDGTRWRELAALDWLRAELSLSLVQIF